MYDNVNDIVLILMTHYQQRWTCQSQVEDLDSSIVHPIITIVQNSQLIILVTEKELEKVLQTMDLDKTLGFDGFPTFFFQKYWHHIKYDVIHACIIFFVSI